MGKDSKIGWTHHTFNGWWGCEKVSPACKHCYAEAFAKRTGNDVWGAEAPRRFFGDAHWAEPLKWNQDAEKAGERRRVFCSSMGDFLEDRRDLDDPRARLFSLIDATPWLDWLLLSKRPENAVKLVPDTWMPGNAWLGVSAENQEEYDCRVPHLRGAGWQGLSFISAEPLLGPLNIGHEAVDFLDWVIVGGESGPKRRPMEMAWVDNLIADCAELDIPIYVKQDVGPIAGLRGRFSDEAWALKQFPRAADGRVMRASDWRSRNAR